jgi:signal transduction histidine kinase
VTPVNGIAREASHIIPAAGSTTARRAVAGMALPVLTVAVAAAGIRGPGGTGIPALEAMGYGLILAWALSGAVAARARERTPQWQVAAGSLAASITLSAARLAGHGGGGRAGAAHAVATLTGPLMIAISLHLLLALPDGRLDGQARRIGAGLGYVAAAGSGAGLAVAGRPVPFTAAALAWSAAVACTLPAVRLEYLRVAGRDRERMQWAAIGAVLAAGVALVAAVLYLLVGWPAPVGAIAAAATAFVPLGMIAGDAPRLGPAGGRLLVQVLSVAGFAIGVAAIYVVVVLGLGRAPSGPGDREVLGLSMLAAAVAAVGYVPARDRLVDWATRFVFGARQAPDEVLRTFGSRLTRAITMDELLLQLAESLRKTMGLTSAEVFTGSGDVLERAAAVPDTGPRSIVVTARERPVVTRAGVSGNAWASVWLPVLLDGREQCQLRVAPVSHAGELLGLIVVERPLAADAFTEEDDRVLTELARQVGLASHNAQLDTALQTTLDELRKQADALRESRARIVASGDAERRRVERNLHDGAQQNLVALAVNLRLARDVVADDPSAAAELLGQMADDVRHTIQELRELAHGIYPPLLADSGLGEALRAAANRSPLAAEVVSEGIGRYSPDVEAAVYFCCLEALQNAAKHAPGARVDIRVWEESGGLLFTVSDDGPGFDAESASNGHGFMNMTDRLGAIGGTVRWQSAPGSGAEVRGSIPLA